MENTTDKYGNVLLGKDARIAVCNSCANDAPSSAPAILDADGTRSDITGEPGVWSHAYEDSWWPCLGVVRAPPAPSPETLEPKRPRYFTLVQSTLWVSGQFSCLLSAGETCEYFAHSDTYIFPHRGGYAPYYHAAVILDNQNVWFTRAPLKEKQG